MDEKSTKVSKEIEVQEDSKQTSCTNGEPNNASISNTCGVTYPYYACEETYIQIKEEMEDKDMVKQKD